MDRKTLFSYLLVFLLSFVIVQAFFSPAKESSLDGSDIVLETQKDTYSIGKEIVVLAQNNTEEAIELGKNCPTPSLEVLQFQSDGYVSIDNNDGRDCDHAQEITLEPGKQQRISLGAYSYTYFNEAGAYKVQLRVNEEVYGSPEFRIKEPGLITRAWRAIIYVPFLNILVGLITLIPGKELWLAVVLLTLIIRTLLLVPSAKAIRSQQAMQAIQPELKKAQEKYKDDQARMMQETMLLYKKHGIHPASSCLPLLIQFPILIGLFYVIQNGLSPDQAGLIYSFLPEFSLHDINSNLLGIDLLERNYYILPPLVGLLQFGQIQLMQQKAGPKSNSDMAQAQRMMAYFMPLLIVFFATQLPAAVSLYWGTSTFYGILQQFVLKTKQSSPESTQSSEDVSVRVIEK